jgi:putative ABC transport system permease protein
VALPRSLGSRVGDEVTLRLGDGASVPVRVVALLDSSRYPSIVVPFSLLAPHVTAGMPGQVLVRTGLSAAALRSRIPEASLSSSDLPDLFRGELSLEAWINYLLAFLAVGYAAIAAVNSLAVLVLSRRAEFAAQTLIGATRGQIRRMLLAEAGTVALLGLMAGTALALLKVIPDAVSSGAWLPTGPVLVFPAVVAAVALIVGPVVVVAARSALRVTPFEALRRP